MKANFLTDMFCTACVKVVRRQGGARTGASHNPGIFMTGRRSYLIKHSFWPCNSSLQGEMSDMHSRTHLSSWTADQVGREDGTKALGLDYGENYAGSTV